MTETQLLINKKPRRFSRRTGCNYGTIKNYSAGIGEFPKWMLDIIKFAIDKGYDKEIDTILKEDFK